MTPSHFLIDDVIIFPSKPLNEENLSLRARLDIVQKVKLCFSKSWSVYYLIFFAKKKKKGKILTESFKVNDVITLKEDNAPPSY